MLTRIRVHLNLRFQFHKGTIRTASGVSSVGSIASFQFHKGTIRTSIRGTENIIDLYISIP